MGERSLRNLLNDAGFLSRVIKYSKIVVIDAKSEYTILYIKWMNCMLCELSLIKIKSTFK